jgi:hypothetical protein
MDVLLVIMPSQDRTNIQPRRKKMKRFNLIRSRKIVLGILSVLLAIAGQSLGDIRSLPLSYGGPKGKESMPWR